MRKCKVCNNPVKEKRNATCSRSCKGKLLKGSINPNYKNRGDRNFRNSVNSLIHYDVGLNIGDLTEEMIAVAYRLLEVKREVFGNRTTMEFQELRRK